MTTSSPASSPPGRRKLFAPEVIQSSAMDCGPASLKSLLEGFGISVGYGRLREACSTDVDGTSIDTLEDVANLLGLDAEQVMLPIDHLLLPESAVLPALLVVQLPNAGAHYVVVWRLHGGFAQVMDPAIGRRWIPCAALLRDAYRHRQLTSAAAWRDYADSDVFRAALLRRIRDLGLGGSVAQAFVGRAASDTGWRAFGALDAAVRMIDRLVASDAVRAGKEAEQLLHRLTTVAADGRPPGHAIPEGFWSVTAAETDGEGEEQVRMRGAIVVRVAGRSTPGAAGGAHTATQLAPELLAALKTAPRSTWRPFFDALRDAGGAALIVVVLAVLAAAATVMVQTLLLRSVIDLGYWLGIGAHRLGAVLALGAFLLGALLVDVPLALALSRLGRRLEVRLRLVLARKIPRTADHYFHSRALSDLAERAHSVTMVRGLPALAFGWLRTASLLALTAAGVLWLAPWLLGWVVATIASALVLSLLSMSLLTEREMRARSHGSVLARFYLDALLGIASIRAHGADASLLREQENVLVQWSGAHRRLQLAGVVVEALQAVLGVSLAVGLVMTHVSREGTSGSLLLVTYWALQLPVLAKELAVSARQVPAVRNVLLRLLEPLDAPEETESDSPAGDEAPLETAPAPATTAAPRVAPKSVVAPLRSWPNGAASVVAKPGHPRSEGVSIAMRGVTVRAGGHTVLEDVRLALAPGEQVAVVGASGAGKSTLIGLLLGWHRAAEGEIRLDDRVLVPRDLAYWRARTAWVDPAVRLFNRRFAENVLYGSEEGVTELPGAIDDADLRGVLERLPDGMQTILGEGGALVSGGEGQRVRLARAWLRRGVRLVLLDEPFRGLARERRVVLLDRARRHWAGSTMICVTHDVSSTLAFGRVLVVEGGRIVEDGDPRELACDVSSRYHAMLSAEQFVRESLWQNRQWRRFRVENGRVAEQAAPEWQDESALVAADLEETAAPRALGPADA